jgi:hypothetical protein
MQYFVRRSTYVPFQRFGGDVRREFMQCAFVALQGTLGSYRRDALHKGIDDYVACLPVPRVGFFLLSSFRRWSPLPFLGDYISYKKRRK